MENRLIADLTLNVAVTGLIASGKSTLIKELTSLYGSRHPVVKFYSVDEMVSLLYTKDFFRDWLKAEFGTLFKREISKIVFNDPVAKEKLEKFTLPYVTLELSKILLTKGQINIIEVPLLFQLNLEHFFDYIVYTEQDKNTLQRIQTRDKVDADTAYKIMNAQFIPGIADRIAACDNLCRINMFADLDPNDTTIDQWVCQDDHIRIQANKAHAAINNAYCDKIKSVLWSKHG